MPRTEGRYYSPSGEMEEDNYIERDVNGRKWVEKNGKTNVYERTQAALPGSTLDEIINRCANGDYSAFVSGGSYMDVTQMPQDLMTALNANIATQKLWETAPDEIKKEYDNIYDFLANYVPEEQSLPTQNEEKSTSTNDKISNGE